MKTFGKIITGLGNMAVWPLLMAAVLASPAFATAVSAQNSLPAPGSGGSYRPAPVRPRPVRPGWGASPGWNNGWGNNWNGPSWGGAGWGTGWASSPTVVINTPPVWTDNGTANVVACGYDAQGVWRTIPLQVSYNFNGVNYDVTVINAWNPWTDHWNLGVDMPAYNTSYYINGQNYDFYTPLTTGTYYFNL